MKIAVYGPGCARCTQTEAVVRDAAQLTGVAADLEKVADWQAITAAGVIATPAVAIDGVIRVMGRIPTIDEARGWLGEHSS